MSRESLLNLLTAICNVPGVSVMLESATGPKGAQRAAVLPREDGRVCVHRILFIGCHSSDATVYIFKASDTHPDRVLTVQTNWFLLAAYRSHWLLWQASLSTSDAQQLAYPAYAVSAHGQIRVCHTALLRGPYMRHTSAKMRACMVSSQLPSLSDTFWPWSATHCTGVNHLVPPRLTPHHLLRPGRDFRYVTCATPR